jgi:ABC-type Mn2+/Zn2+ transport system ATPase subunit
MDLSIVVKELSFKYQNGASALENISFSVKPGSRVLLIGSNGAGKVRVKHESCGILLTLHQKSTLLQICGKSAVAHGSPQLIQCNQPGNV